MHYLYGARTGLHWYYASREWSPEHIARVVLTRGEAPYLYIIFERPPDQPLVVEYRVDAYYYLIEPLRVRYSVVLTWVDLDLDRILYFTAVGATLLVAAAIVAVLYVVACRRRIL